MTTLPREQTRGATAEGKPLGELDRISTRLRIGVSGLLFFLIAMVLVWIHRLISGMAPVIDGAFFGRMARLIVLAALITPLIFWAVQRLLRASLPIAGIQGYRRLLIAPLALSAVALPLLFVQAVWAEAMAFIAANTALAAPNLLAYSWLRRFPDNARIVEADDHIEVHAGG